MVGPVAGKRKPKGRSLSFQTFYSHLTVMSFYCQFAERQSKPGGIAIFMAFHLTKLIENPRMIFRGYSFSRVGH